MVHCNKDIDVNGISHSSPDNGYVTDEGDDAARNNTYFDHG